MRCPACRALNPAGAAWCGQCLTPFPSADTVGPGEGRFDGSPPHGPAAVASAADHGEGPAAAAAAGPAPGTARSGDVRTVEGEVEWRCPVCDGWNALLRPACIRCGGERHGFGAGVGRSSGAASTADPTLVLLTTIVWPGVGHVLAGRIGTGVARALLWALWGGGAVWLTVAGAGPARWAAASTAAGAVVLWVASVVEVRSRGGAGDPRLLAGPQLLGGRRLGVLVAAVTTALLVGPLVAAGS